MQVNIRAIVGALALVAGGSQMAVARAPIPPLSDANYSAREIRDYASALVKVLSVGRIADLRWHFASATERLILQRQATAAVTAVLRRYGFTALGFSEMSAAVERQPALRRQVHHLVTREGLGFQ